ncbi:hypothetical protein [Bradyrhizobium sp. USDA 4011]
MIASAVDTRKTGFLLFARRRNTELRLPAISCDGSNPSNGKVFSLGNTSTSSEGSSECSTLPRRSALFSLSARKTMPSRPDFFHCSRRCSASMPSGEEDEIPERVNPLLFFLAPAAARAFLVFATSNPSLRRESDRLVRGFRGDSELVAHRHGNQSSTDFQTAGAIPPEITARPRSVESIPPSKSIPCLMAGAGGIEPPNGGIKIRLITQ